MSEFLSQLSDVQRAAAENYDGPTLIVAGAGSGKTRVLTARIAYMISRGVPPYTVLALTFTNKAAGEMRERISKVVGPELARKIWMGTFHSVFSRFLRAEAEKLGFTGNFTIYETSDSRNLVKTIIKEMNLNDDRYKPKDIFSRISFQKNNLVTPQMYLSSATLLAEDREAGRDRFGDVYREYMVRCRRNNAMDFDDLLLYTNILLRDFPEAVEKYQHQFRYILVDEYQDTNRSQYLIVKKLAEVHQNICVVGDDAQSIYSFRGAKIENILRFQTDYPSARVYPLEQNYRSTQTIVNAANSVIDRNENRIRKKSFSRNELGDKIQLIRAYTEREEAIAVVSGIKRTLQEDTACSFGDVAVLYRTNSQSRVLEDVLKSRQIPYRIYGGISFYQRAEIKHVLAYARLLVNSDDDEALMRIINVPARGIGDTTVGKIAAYAAGHSASMWRSMEDGVKQDMQLRGGAVVNKLTAFIRLIRTLKEYSAQHNVYETLYEIVTASGLLGSYKNARTPEAESACQNIEELLNSTKQVIDDRMRAGEPLPVLEEWLQEITLLTDEQEEGGGTEKSEVSLMTVHSAKGLEYKYIYIVGMEEGVFPGQRTAETQEALEEERRLFYVAITRAISRLSISFCLSRYRWGTTVNSMPSRFLKEVDKQYLSDPELLESGRTVADEPEEESRGRHVSSRPVETPMWRKRPFPAEKETSVAGNRFSSANPGLERRIASLRKLPPVSRGGGKPGSGNDALVSADRIRTGSVVEHDTFGRGVVTAVDRTVADVKLEVCFDGAGPKKLLLRFARLRILEE